MAAYRWTGLTSGVWKLAANWVSYPDGGAVAKYPGETALTYDDVYFDKKKGSGNDCAGVSGLTEALSSIFIGSEWDGTVGTGGTPVDVTCSTVMIENTTGGAIYLSGESSGSIGMVIVRAGTNVNLGGKISNIYLLKGTVALQSTLDMSTGGGSIFISKITASTDVTATVASGAVLPTGVYQNSGTVTYNNLINTLHISGGLAKIYNAVDTSVNLYGGEVQWYQGQITFANLFGGTFDATKSTVARALTGCILGPDAILNVNTPTNNITFTEPITHLGGTFYPPSGSNIAIS